MSAWNIGEMSVEDCMRFEDISSDYDDLWADLAKNRDEDLSHPIVFVNGVLRWQEDPLISEMVAHELIDLNRVRILPEWMQRELYKKLGYSLCGYAEIFGSTSAVQGWKQ